MAVLYGSFNMKVIIHKEVSGLGEAIKAARNKRSVTPLAAAAGISSAYWYAIEGEQKDAVSAEVIQAMAAALGMNDCFGVLG